MKLNVSLRAGLQLYKPTWKKIDINTELKSKFASGGENESRNLQVLATMRY